MKKVLVTGSKGQMGQALKSISGNYPKVDFVFMDRDSLDITCQSVVDEVFDKILPDYCFNFAAYTAVDKAEEDVESAFKINGEGVFNLAKACVKHNTILIHLSTDFIFDGTKSSPYFKDDIPNPINVYGVSKLKGEEYVKEILQSYYIVRTSWLYSDFGHNFKQTMLRLSNANDEINVVDDQVGAPTNALELCCFLMNLMQEKREYGVYHYRGEKVCSWYEFAVSIFRENNINIKVNPITTEEYPTKARRPKYSVLDLG
ncbi:dTDP-4-dehydrorhamnose reductase [Myroides albus]|uniref:dTDP-4-dehydrorhamnose reductase n=1 Tax=Myroides albus TaxID=2562892 RepID=UPI00215910CB|nr:dTDP-4-dehydrorhamnose reductase [Myroides albus]UVD81018.1 dTDP-4-dehydrorhamnose reductase [Myroides albus]